MWSFAAWWLETERFVGTGAALPYPKGEVAPLRHDLELARYLEKKREWLLSPGESSMIIASAATPKEEMNDGIAFDIVSAVGSRS